MEKIDMERIEVPNDFNWEEYVTLNHFFKIPFDEKSAQEHYINYGFGYGLPYNFKNIKIIIYSGGKTGTATLRTSFCKIVASNNILSIHSNLQIRTQYTISDIINNPRINKILMCCSYREPISQYLSNFFQNIENLLGKKFDEIIDFVLLTDQIIKYMDNSKLFPHPFLENDKKNFNNIDIFEKPFNKEKGFQIFETDKIKIILLRFDKINQWDNIIQNNTPFTYFELASSNLTIHKPEYSLYKRVCEEIIIPKTILDKIYDTEDKNMNYFYTLDEIKVIKNKWYGRLNKIN